LNQEFLVRIPTELKLLLDEGAPLHKESMIEDLASNGQAKLFFASTESLITHWMKEEEFAGMDTLTLGVAPVHGGNSRLFESLRYNDEFCSDSLTSF
jgi:hypothetical protein